MGLEATQVQALRYRRPWYWLVVLAVAASLATWLILADGRARIAQIHRGFDLTEQQHLQRMADWMNDYFVGAIQLVAAGTETFGAEHESRDAVRAEILDLYRSRRVSGVYEPGVYGIGVFYAPFAFEPGTKLFSVYDHVTDLAVPLRVFDHLRGDQIDEVVFASNAPKPSDDYTAFKWYQRAAGSPGSTRFAGPYVEDGRSFISTMKAFYRGHRLAGVVSVDVKTENFTQGMLASLTPGEIAWIESSTRGKNLLATAPLKGDLSTRIDRAVPLRYSGVLLHLSTDVAPLLAIDRRIVSTGWLYAALVWFGAATFGIAIVRGWRSRESNLALELQRARLENEVAIGKKVEGELRKAAYTDALTGLPNRAVYLERASEAIALEGSHPFAIFFIDLDRFNIINETMGHFAGDELLKMIAARLRTELPEEALVARLGGDEFLVLAQTPASDAGAFADRILASLHDPMVLGGRAIHTTASIGVVVLDAEYRRPEELLRDADIAMYAAKLRGRACFAIFDAAMRRKVASDSDLDNDLRRAIARHEFVPYYQPIVSIETRAVISFEALARWNRPGLGVVAAGEFIEFAESHGLVDAIDTSILDDVCADAAALFERFPSASVAVNISAGHLMAPGLAASVERALLARSIAPERIRLEITETAIMTDTVQARATLAQLRLDGMQIVLDDFGAGHSSLAYLHRLPIAGLKIDRSFVEPLVSDPQTVAIVRSIVALAQTLGLYTVAEGVETAEQLEILRQLGVLYAQGFFFSPALELAALLQFAAQSNAS